MLDAQDLAGRTQGLCVCVSGAPSRFPAAAAPAGVGGCDTAAVAAVQSALRRDVAPSAVHSAVHSAVRSAPPAAAAAAAVARIFLLRGAVRFRGHFGVHLRGIHARRWVAVGDAARAGAAPDCSQPEEAAAAAAGAQQHHLLGVLDRLLWEEAYPSTHALCVKLLIRR